MKAITRLLLAVAVAATATVTFAQVSSKYDDFATGPVQWIMSKEEKAQWKAVTNDADAQKFVYLFWARRDPTPGTPRNEFKESFDQRVAYGDQHFAVARTRGSMTDPGRVLIILGPPTRMSSTQRDNQPEKFDSPTASGNPALGGRANPEDSVTGTTARMIMVYERAKVGALGFPEGTPDFEVGFTDQFGTKQWKLSPGRYDVFGLMNKMVEKAVVNPTANVPPVITTDQTTTTKKTTTTTAAPAAPTPGLNTAALQAAVAAQKGGTSTISSGNSGSYAEFVAPSGDFYVPLGILVPKSANLAADAVDTVFGQVEDASGKVVTSFEEPVKPTMSNGALFADRSVTLPTGKYTAVIGVAKAGTPVAIASESLDVNEAPKDVEGIARMVLTNNLAEIPEAAPEKTGFAFGKMKVIPTFNFAKTDDLILFLEVHNPGIDPASNAPKLQTKLELSGGKLTKPIPRQLMDAQVAPLSGKPGPGQYAIIDSIPLGQIPSLAPGDYTLKVKVVDTVTKQSYEAQQSFKITG